MAIRRKSSSEKLVKNSAATVVEAPITAERQQAYRAEMAGFTPIRFRKKLGLFHKAFFAVHLDEKLDTAKLAACVDWINRNFTECTILICDSIHRLKLQMSEGLDEKDSWNKAYRLGKEFFETHGHLFSNDKGCNYKIQYTSDVKKTVNYRRLYDLLTAMFAQDPDFEKAVKHTAFQFMEKQDKIENTVYVPGSNHNAVYLSCQFFLEELAAFGWLIKHGHNAFIFPGSNELIDEIIDGKHDRIPEVLKRLVHIELKIREKGYIKRWISRKFNPKFTQ